MDLITLTIQDILSQALWTLWNSTSVIIGQAVDRVLKFFVGAFKKSELFYFNIYLIVTHFHMIRIIIKCIINRNSFSDPKIITEELVIIDQGLSLGKRSWDIELLPNQHMKFMFLISCLFQYD